MQMLTNYCVCHADDSSPKFKGGSRDELALQCGWALQQPAETQVIGISPSRLCRCVFYVKLLSIDVRWCLDHTLLVGMVSIPLNRVFNGCHDARYYI